jgi:hypothetical protein
MSRRSRMIASSPWGSDMNGEILGALPKNRWEEVQVRGILHEGVPFIDVRVFRLDEEGRGGEAAIPTGKGITLHVRRLPDLLEALEKARPYYEARIAEQAERVQRDREGRETRQRDRHKRVLRGYYGQADEEMP